MHPERLDRVHPVPRVHASKAGPDEPDLCKSDVPEPGSRDALSAFQAVERRAPERQASPEDESTAPPCRRAAELPDAPPAARLKSVSRVDAMEPRFRPELLPDVQRQESKVPVAGTAESPFPGSALPERDERPHAGVPAERAQPLAGERPASASAVHRA